MIISEQAQTRAMILDLMQQKELEQATSSSFLQSTGNRKPSKNTLENGEARVRNLLLSSLGFPGRQDHQEEVAPELTRPPSGSSRSQSVKMESRCGQISSSGFEMEKVYTGSMVKQALESRR